MSQSTEMYTTQLTKIPADALQRFLDAQEPVLDQVLGELRNGRKESHWMWFIFPQIAGLGNSRMSRLYAIADLTEAKDYASHPTLGPRLTACFKLVLMHGDKTAEEIFGGVDARKFHSCATLFQACTADGSVFEEALATFYEGERDQLTLALLSS